MDQMLLMILYYLFLLVVVAALLNLNSLLQHFLLKQKFVQLIVLLQVDWLFLEELQLLDPLITNYPYQEL
jgi:hypothetical protein